MSELKEKVAIITGASSGIGAATAKLFAQKGCFLSLTGRNEEGLRNTQKICIDAGLAKDQVSKDQKPIVLFKKNQNLQKILGFLFCRRINR